MNGACFARLRAATTYISMVAICGASLLLSVTAAEAYTKRVERACRADYQNLCPGYRLNSSQLRACMEAKSGSISWGCIEALVDAGEVDKKRVARGR